MSLAELQDRRKQSLCYNCDEQYVRGHHCQRLFYIEVADYDNEEIPEHDIDEATIISLHAFTGIRTEDTMQLNIQYKGAVLRALLDSGSTHNFINSATTCHLGMPIRPCTGLRVGVANSDKIACEGRTLDVPITIGMEAFSISCYAIPLGSFDVILGVEYLRTLGPILWHFDDLCMAFWRGDRWVFCNTQRSTRGSNNQYKMTNYKFRCGVVVFTRRRNSYVVSPSLFYACYLGRRKVKEVKKNFRCGRRCSLLGRTSFRKDDGQIHVQASCKQ